MAMKPSTYPPAKLGQLSVLGDEALPVGHAVIVPLIVQEVLEEQIARKLARPFPGESNDHG